jgi:hypothetical protein
MSDKTETTTLNSDGDFRVMLHYVGDGLVELEVWDSEKEVATHTYTGFFDAGKQSVDITDDIVTALQEAQGT